MDCLRELAGRPYKIWLARSDNDTMVIDRVCLARTWIFWDEVRDRILAPKGLSVETVALPTSVLLFAIVVLTFLSAYFSSSETAMMKLNPYRLKNLVRKKHRGARKANRLLRRQDRLLGVILIGNNLVNNAAATVAAVIGVRLFGDTGLALAPVVLTIYFLIFAEIAPKTIAAERP